MNLKENKFIVSNLCLFCPITTKTELMKNRELFSFSVHRPPSPPFMQDRIRKRRYAADGDIRNRHHSA